MTVTLNPTCPLCGLRFASRPLLDLHLREDHRDEDHRAPDPTPEPGHHQPVDDPHRRRYAGVRGRTVRNRPGGGA
jgi:hypothetical protein